MFIINYKKDKKEPESAKEIPETVMETQMDEKTPEDALLNEKPVEEPPKEEAVLSQPDEKLPEDINDENNKEEIPSDKQE